MSIKNVIPEGIHPKIWQRKNYKDIILYALSFHGKLNRAEFLKKDRNDIYRLNKTTFYKYLNRLLEKKLVKAEKEGKFVFYKITTSGENYLLKRLIEYGLDFKTLNKAERKKIETGVEQLIKFFDQYKIRDEELKVDFLKLSNEIPRDKFELFSKDQYNKLLLFLALNHPKYFKYTNYPITINSFLEEYNTTIEGKISETDIKMFLQEVVEKDIYNIGVFKLIIEDSDINLFFLSRFEYGIIFETTIQNQLRFLNYLKSLKKIEPTESDLEEISEVILLKLIKKYQLFHPILEKPLYNLLRNYIENIKLDLAKKPNKMIDYLKDIYSLPIGLPPMPEEYEPKHESWEDELIDMQFTFNDEETHELENSFYVKARAFYEEHKYEAAIKYLDKAINLDPRSIESYDLKAHIYHISGNYEKALLSIDKAIELEKDKDIEWSDYYQKKSYILSDMGKYDQALDTIEKAIALGNELDMYYKDKANILRKMEKYNEALLTINKSIQLIEYDWETPFYVKAIILYEMKDFENAFEVNEEAVKLEPPWGGPYYLKAKLLSKKKKYEEAYELNETALYFNPEKLKYQKLKINLLGKLGKFQEILELMESTTQIDLYFSAVETLEIEKRLDLAKQLIKTALKIDPGNLKIQFQEFTLDTLIESNSIIDKITYMAKEHKENMAAIMLSDLEPIIQELFNNIENRLKIIQKVRELFNLGIFSFDEYTRYIESFEFTSINPLWSILDKIKKLGEVINKNSWTKRANSIQSTVYYVYVLELKSSDGIKSYYTGYTNSLNEAIRQHWEGKGSKLTQNKSIELKYYETFIGKSQAFERKKEIQQLSDDEIEELIKSIK